MGEKKTCECCGSEFILKNKFNTGRFCKRECYWDSMDLTTLKNCKRCNKEFIVTNNRQNIAKYCTHKCYSESRKGLKRPREYVEKTIRTKLNKPNRKTKKEIYRSWYEKHKLSLLLKRQLQRLKDPRPFQARNAVNRAVGKGKLSNINKCQCNKCERKANHYHHRMGYEKENWLIVEPLCYSCHKNEDVNHGK